MTTVPSQRQQDVGPPPGAIRSVLDTHALIGRAFLWMTGGFALTTLIAWITSRFATLPDIVTSQPVLSVLGLVMWFVFGLGFNWFVRHLPAIVGAVFYVVYCVLTGVVLSGVFSTYTEATIVHALVSTIGLFVIITAFALLTRIDLTRWWLYVIFGILGLLLATFLNTVVFRSETLDLILSYAGIALFGVSTAATVQKIVRMEHELDPRLHDRAAIIGAMMLYTNVINLFLRLLELYSRRERRAQSG